MRFCTVIASNYLAYARVLAASVRAQHPECTMTVLVIDDEPVEARTDDHFDVARAADIGLAQEEFRHMAAIYTVTELATAVKPTLLTSLLDTYAEPVCYLDPDIELFARLDGLEDLARRHGVVLTPHTTTPIPRDEKLMTEQVLLLAGLYNLGFVAVSERGRPFLDWWGERLRRDCRIAVGEGMFVDQRWVDLASTCFEHFAVSDPGWNVAYWNLHARSVTHGPDGYLVEGRPLRFFHFSGFSPLQPHRLSKHQGDDPRIRLAEHPAVAQLCARYAAKLLGAGYLQSAGRPYRFDYTGTGVPLDARMRHLYRRALECAESEHLPACLPDPFEPTTAHQFLDWLCLPAGTAGIERIPRYLRQFYDERMDLQIHFPDLSGPHGEGYLQYIRRYGQSDTNLPPWCSRTTDSLPEWVPTSGSDPPSPSGPPSGVNVIGYLHAENGVGEVARLLVDTLRHAAVPYAAISCDQTPARQEEAVYRSARPAVYDLNVICVNADQIQRLPGSSFAPPPARRTVGVWAWEVAGFPEWMARSAALVDEVWTYSRHSADAIAAAIGIPVHVFPPPIVPRRAVTPDRAALTLPEGFLFLFCFDYLSVFERKNPLAVVQAFSRAFAAGEGPQLVVKTVNARSFPIESARLGAAAADRPDITIIDGYYTRAEQDALMACCDAYVSLHRAEGYGLTLAEAMALGKPTIATGYSGNLEFMNADNSRLVPYRMSPIPFGCMPYPPGVEWAEPDVEVAAEMMRELASDPHAAARLGARARRDVGGHGPAARAAFVVERLLCTGTTA